jgi:hypothetical protein
MKKMVWTNQLVPKRRLIRETAAQSIAKAAARRLMGTFGGRGTKSELITIVYD